MTRTQLALTWAFVYGGIFTVVTAVFVWGLYA